jgi:hypothetical protein
LSVTQIIQNVAHFFSVSSIKPKAAIAFSLPNSGDYPLETSKGLC